MMPTARHAPAPPQSQRKGHRHRYTTHGRTLAGGHPSWPASHHCTRGGIRCCASSRSIRVRPARAASSSANASFHTAGCTELCGDPNQSNCKTRVAQPRRSRLYGALRCASLEEAQGDVLVADPLQHSVTNPIRECRRGVRALRKFSTMPLCSSPMAMRTMDKITATTTLAVAFIARSSRHARETATATTCAHARVHVCGRRAGHLPTSSGSPT